MSDWFWQQLSVPRRPSKARAVVFIVAMNAGLCGFFLVAFWVVVTYPGKSDAGMDSQPSPSWLWQVGVALVIGALLTFVILVLSAPRVPDADAPFRPMFETTTWPTWTWAVLMLAEVLVIAVVVGVAADDGDFRWYPLYFSTIMAVVVPFVSRSH